MMDKPKVEDLSHKYAGTFLVTESGRIIGQHRDDKEGIDNPGKVTSFGGEIESGETPAECAWRELTGEWEARYFYYAVISDEMLENLEVYEGQGWIEVHSSDDLNLANAWRIVVKQLREVIEDDSGRQ